LIEFKEPLMKTIVGMFDHVQEAHEAVADLTGMGLKCEDISVITPRRDAAESEGEAPAHETRAPQSAGIGAAIGAGAGILASLGLLLIPGAGPFLAAGPIVAVLAGAGVGAAAGGIIGGLIGLGIPEEDAAEYAEGIRRGGTVVTAKVNDEQAQEATAILERHHAVDLNARAQEWRSTGWTPEPATRSAPQASTGASAAPAPQSAARETRASEAGRTIPIVDETINVGKREVPTGRVRVYAHVAEEPVNEQVRLRQEHVRVERRAADRPATEEDLAAFQEGTVELHETSEEPVVEKKARVTGEVVVRKDVEEKTQDVRDTVRRTKVDVQKIEGEGRDANAPMPSNPDVGSPRP
jgi:uncharacterized protein (TIGR02271 family)